MFVLNSGASSFGLADPHNRHLVASSPPDIPNARLGFGRSSVPLAPLAEAEPNFEVSRTCPFVGIFGFLPCPARVVRAESRRPDASRLLRNANAAKSATKSDTASVQHAPIVAEPQAHTRNKCVESLQTNVERLKTYMSKLVIFPKRSGKKGVKKGDTPRSELKNVAQNTLREIIPIERPKLLEKCRAITAEDKEFSAYKKLKKARTDKKFLGAKLKKQAEAKKEG